jgi:hypothetical protein
MSSKSTGSAAPKNSLAPSLDHLLNRHIASALRREILLKTAVWRSALSGNKLQLPLADDNG